MAAIIHLLGGLRITDEDGSTRNLDIERKEQALLAYLLMRPGRRIERAELIEIFWPEREPQVGCRCLNTAVWRLRRGLDGLGEIHLNTSRGMGLVLSLDPPLVADLWHFRRLAGAIIHSSTYRGHQRLSKADLAHLETAVRLYDGPFLPGVEAAWVDRERQALEDEYLQCLFLLGRHFEQMSEHERALTFYQRALAIDPANEEIHVAAMTSYEALGHRSLALRQYAICVAVLRDTLGVEVASETCRLAAAIAGDQGMPPSGPPRAPQRAISFKAACSELAALFAQMREAAAHAGELLRTLEQAGQESSIFNAETPRSQGGQDRDC